MLGATTNSVAEKRASMTFVVKSNNFNTLTKITNIIEESLGRKDESARDVNKYKSQVPAYKGIRFGEIHVALVEGGGPETQEGGRQSAIVNVSFTYFIEHDINTTPVPTI
jgi:hypothetical protein